MTSVSKLQPNKLQCFQLANMAKYPQKKHNFIMILFPIGLYFTSDSAL